MVANTHHRNAHKDNLVEMHCQVVPRYKETGRLNQLVGVGGGEQRAATSQRVQEYMLYTSCPDFALCGIHCKMKT